MTDMSHAEADLLAVEVEAGRASEAERMRLEVHLQGCEDCARRHARIGSLVEGLQAEPSCAPDRTSDASIAMQAALQSRKPLRAPRFQAPGRWALAAAAVLLLGLGGLGGAVLLGRASATAPTTTRTPAQEPAPEPDVEGTPPLDVPELAVGEVEQPCRGVSARAAEGSVARVGRSEPRDCRIRLEQGTLQMHVDPEVKTHVRVRAPDATAEVLGTVFAVQAEQGGTRVAVERGAVLVTGAAGKVRVRKGQEARMSSGAEAVPEVHAADEDDLTALVEVFGLAPTDGTAEETPAGTDDEQVGATPAPRRSGRSVSELRRMVHEGRAAEARAEARSRSERVGTAHRQAELMTIVAESYVVEGEHDEAVRTYRRVADGRASATGGNALMAAAGLLLDQLGRPDEALHLYDRYLNEHPRGGLREMASLERCRAVRAAGRRRDAHRCAEQYLDRFPDGSLRQRAERLLAR